MKITSPAAAAKFTVTAAAEWPAIPFATDAAGPHAWKWAVAWGTFTKSGTASTPGNTWDAKTALTDLGGTLTVTATAGKDSATVKVEIVGTNPTLADVTTYLATKPDSGGFDKLIAHESKGKHFTAAGVPIKSFDGGYGMCQLTTPAPTAAQVWNWKRNVDGGLALFAVKRAAALTYLTQSNRTYTADQLAREAVCRWNGGSYHTWDGKAWVRNPDVLCDTATGNIGWDTTVAENKDKTEADLRKRDKDSYGDPTGSKGKKTAANKWKYSGVCYADRVLG